MAEQLIRCVNSKTNKVVFFKKSVITDSWMKASGFKPEEVSRETSKDTKVEKVETKQVKQIPKMFQEPKKERSTHFPTNAKPEKAADVKDEKAEIITDKKEISPESLKESQNAI